MKMLEKERQQNSTSVKNSHSELQNFVPKTSGDETKKTEEVLKNKTKETQTIDNHNSHKKKQKKTKQTSLFDF
jgi:hypothetical protein